MRPRKQWLLSDSLLDHVTNQLCTCIASIQFCLSGPFRARCTDQYNTPTNFGYFCSIPSFHSWFSQSSCILNFIWNYNMYYRFHYPTWFCDDFFFGWSEFVISEELLVSLDSYHIVFYRWFINGFSSCSFDGFRNNRKGYRGRGRRYHQIPVWLITIREEQNVGIAAFISRWCFRGTFREYFRGRGDKWNWGKGCGTQLPDMYICRNCGSRGHFPYNIATDHLFDFIINYSLLIRAPLP